jgi:hypothetical protein
MTIAGNTAGELQNLLSHRNNRLATIRSVGHPIQPLNYQKIAKKARSFAIFFLYNNKLADVLSAPTNTHIISLIFINNKG